jgi:hypothetical protein
MAPVEVLKDRPADKDGEIAKVIGDVPPAAVTGVKDVAAVVAVKVLVAMARVVERTEAISSENVFVAVAEPASVIVTVYVSGAPDTVGVPVMAPVEGFIDNPEGRDGETE